MGANPGEYFVPEPANADQAAKAREAALVELDAFVAAHSGSALAAIAAIKAAELEVDLGKLDAADQRLAALAGSLGPDDPKRAIALRLRGYTLDQRGQTLAAAETYADAAKVEAYPARGVVWIEAGDCFARAKAPDRAIAAYREALAMRAGALGAAARDPADRDPAGADRFRAAAGATGAGRRGTGGALKGPGRRIVWAFPVSALASDK